MKARPHLRYAWLVLAALVPYAGTWTHDFVNYDDGSAILGLPLIRQLDLASLPAFFRPDVYAGLPEYMPLKNLSYAIDYTIFGPWAPGFRVQQSLWYLAAIVVTFVWLRVLFSRMADHGTLGLDASVAPTLAFATTVLFAVHPAHVESVTWLSGRKDLLCGAFMSGALAVALGAPSATARMPEALAVGPRASAARSFRRPAAVLALTALALLSKPMAVVLPALFLAQDVACARHDAPLTSVLRQRAPLYLSSLALCAAFAALYHSLTHLAAANTGDPMGTYAGPAWTRWGQQLGAFAWLSFLPAKLTPIYPPDLLDPALASWRSIGGLCLVAFLMVACVRTARRSPPLFLAIALFVVPLLPIVARPAWNQHVANRYLFHAVLGAIAVLTWGAARLAHARPRLTPLVVLAGAVLAGTWCLATVGYNRAWRDGSTLWRHAASVTPRFPRAYALGASAALREGRMDLAIEFLARCVEVDADDATCAGMLGGILLQPDPTSGEALLRRALPRDHDGIAHRRLAQHLASTGRAQEGLALLERFLHGRSPDTGEIAALVDLALAAGQLDKALAYARSTVVSAAVNHAASPPPADVVLRVARARADGALERRAEAAKAACARSDCFRQRLSW